MDLFAAIRAFVRTVERGSMTAVARDLGVSQPAVSKLLRNLEAHLGTRVLERSSRALRLTPPGQSFYESVGGTLSAVDAAVEMVRGGGGEVGGRLRLHGPVCLGERHLQRIVSDFRKRHSGVAVELMLGNDPVDLVASGIDVAIAVERPAGQDVVARRIGTVDRVLVASPGYLSRRGPIRGRRSLAEQEIVVTGRVLSRRGTIRLLREGVATDLPVRPVLTTNSAKVLVDALTSGQGVGVAQLQLVADELHDGRLVRVLPRYEVEPCELFVCTPSGRHLRPAVRRFIDFAVPALRKVEGVSQRSEARPPSQVRKTRLSSRLIPMTDGA